MIYNLFIKGGQMPQIGSLLSRETTNGCIHVELKGGNVMVSGVNTVIYTSKMCFTPTGEKPIIDMSHRDIVLHTIKQKNSSLSDEEIDNINISSIKRFGDSTFKIVI